MRTSDAPELDTFKRHIHLVEYACARYGYQRDRRESSRSSHVLRHASSDDKIVVGKDTDGHWIYFSIRDDRDNGTIVDFVQRRGTLSLGQTRAELRDWLGTPRPDPGPDVRPDTRPVSHDRLAVAAFVAQLPDVANSPYLNARGIRPETLQDPRFAGTWKCDARRNTLFIHRDDDGVTGFEIKNTCFTGFSKSGQKTAWQSAPVVAEHTVLVLAETAIDALSYAQLGAATFKLAQDGTVRTDLAERYLSTAGALSPLQYELLGKTFAALPDRCAVLLAFDNDRVGQNTAAAVHALALPHHRRGLRVERHTPPFEKDWNEHLQRIERDYIRSLPPAVRALAPSKDRGR